MSEKELIEVCVLHQGWIRYELAMLLIDVSRDGRYQTIVSSSDKKPRQNNYNFAANRFLMRWPHPDYLLLLNDDCVPYNYLLDAVGLGLDIVSFPMPLARWRETPLVPIQWNFSPLDESEWRVEYSEMPMEVARGGTGAMLIARRVLEHEDMSAPFTYVYDDTGELVKGLDMNFCDRAREAGFKVHVAMSHRCGHVNEVDLGEVQRVINLKEEVSHVNIDP